MVGLVECGTHVVFDAALGPLRTGEHDLARKVFPSLRSGVLLLADRGFFGVDLWHNATATGADLLWRVRKDIVLPVIERLPDGSYVSEIFGPGNIHHTSPGIRVRVVESSSPPSATSRKLYGFLLVHHAIRTLMHLAAREGDHDPDRVSFTRTLRVVRRQVTDQAAFSPQQTRPRTQGRSH